MPGCMGIFYFYLALELREMVGAEPQSLISVSYIPGIYPKALLIEFAVKAYVMLLAIRPLDGHIKASDALGAF